MKAAKDGGIESGVGMWSQVSILGLNWCVSCGVE